MSYDVTLRYKNGNVALVNTHAEGGTFAAHGDNRACLNVTYNYGEVYRLLDFSLAEINHTQAKDTIELFRTLVEKLGDKPYKDYWAPTPGNAGHALAILLKWAKAHPDAFWEVS